MQYYSASPSRVLSNLSACIAALTQQALFFQPIHFFYLFLVVGFKFCALQL